MEPNTQQKIKEQFATLPSDIQKAIMSVDLGDKLKKISEKYSLSLSQGAALEYETFFVMLGLEHPKGFVKNLAREVELPEAKAREVAQDVNEQIFRTIRESLKKIHQIHGEEEESRIPEPEQARYGAGKNPADAHALAGKQESRKQGEHKTVAPPDELPVERREARSENQELRSDKQEESTNLRPELSSSPSPRVEDRSRENQGLVSSPAPEQFSLKKPPITIGADEEMADRDQMLREIENPPRYGFREQEQKIPAPSAPPSRNMVQEKLETVSHLPKEVKKYELDEEKSVPQQPQKKHEPDPYREPIE